MFTAWSCAKFDIFVSIGLLVIVIMMKCDSHVYVLLQQSYAPTYKHPAKSVTVVAPTSEFRAPAVFLLLNVENKNTTALGWLLIVLSFPLNFRENRSKNSKIKRETRIHAIRYGDVISLFLFPEGKVF
jgi:hypothetical protein